MRRIKGILDITVYETQEEVDHRFGLRGVGGPKLGITEVYFKTDIKGKAFEWVCLYTSITDVNIASMLTAYERECKNEH